MPVCTTLVPRAMPCTPLCPREVPAEFWRDRFSSQVSGAQGTGFTDRPVCVLFSSLSPCVHSGLRSGVPSVSLHLSVPSLTAARTLQNAGSLCRAPQEQRLCTPEKAVRTGEDLRGFGSLRSVQLSHRGYFFFGPLCFPAKHKATPAICVHVGELQRATR